MWHDYTTRVAQHTVVGDLRVYPALHSPQLDNARDVLVWLPPGYAAGDQRYPVLYMHDGQNLFDAHSTYAGEWRVDETLTALHDEGLDAIVVGLPNQGELRRVEYNPYPWQAGSFGWEGRGDDYIAFIADTVKPLIDSGFRTRPERAATGIAGSSMGGLISLHGYLTRPDVFGLCGAFSPVYFITDGLQRTISERADGAGRVYLDIGGKEGEVVQRLVPGGEQNLDAAHRAYVDGVRGLRDGLLARGYRLNETLLYVEDADAPHNEAAWAQRLPVALRFLLGN
jgi:predicted alpha/beta superfamily hydrolase